MAMVMSAIEENEFRRMMEIPNDETLPSHVVDIYMRLKRFMDLVDPGRPMPLIGKALILLACGEVDRTPDGVEVLNPGPAPIAPVNTENLKVGDRVIVSWYNKEYPGAVAVLKTKTVTVMQDNGIRKSYTYNKVRREPSDADAHTSDGL